MDVVLVGDGPAVNAVERTLADASVGTKVQPNPDIEGAQFAVVCDLAGAETFDLANDAALRGKTPWVAIEVGGIGGRPVVDLDAALSGFTPATGCYSCLCKRVAADRNGARTDDGPTAARSAVAVAGAIAGHEIVQLLSGDQSALPGGVIEVPHHTRQFLPVPGCECSSNPGRTIDFEYEPSPVESALQRAERALDERVGLVRSIGEIESFPAPYYLASLCDTTDFSDANVPAQAAGVDFDWNAAFMKALGEALERYGAAVYDEAEFQSGTASDFESVVDPSRFVTPESVDVTADEQLQWIEGVHLGSRESVVVPAGKAYFPPPSRALGPAITTGLGLGSSTVGALLSGLYEVIERDATMLAWYSTFEPLAVSIDDEGFDSLARRARGEGLTVTPLLVTQDIDVPVITVAVHRDDEWPRFAVGSAANLEPIAAARSALAEALQNWMELRSIGPEDASDESGAIGEYSSFPKAARDFVDTDTSVPIESIGPDAPPEGKAELNALVERIESVGLTPYGVRLTTCDLHSIGFEVVRAVVPEAQPLFTGDSFFGERARTVPDELGFETRLDRSFHPYP